MILFSSKDSVVLKNGPSPEDDMLISPCLEKLMRYINKNWNKSLTFKPENWCIYQSAICTNNDVEGWHKRLIPDHLGWGEWLWGLNGYGGGGMVMGGNDQR